jgi:hypothetical protein
MVSRSAAQLDAWCALADVAAMARAARRDDVRVGNRLLEGGGGCRSSADRGRGASQQFDQHKAE